MNFNKRVAFYTLGCKVNQYETESIKNQLLQKGYTETALSSKQLKINSIKFIEDQN